ncbi:unnamed protein product [Cladocopium goreaui]|uniref:Uncharacterized protein n=1 Tax=Cladocopium goreaui TaxID=2562237 RepID=A0A9P1GA97_9DINO|nr:unnamed protein product [Cladocopium goreaui]
MAAVAEALHSEVECDSNHQEISQAVFCVTGPMQQDQLPEDAKVRVVNVSGCDKERQDQLVSVFLSEACGVPVHLESNEDDMDDMDDNGSARTMVLKGQDGDHLVLLLSSEMCEIQLAPGILAHMVHILGDPEDANLDALFCAMPEQTDDISLSLLFPEDLPESIWSGLAAASKAAGFRSVSAVPLCHASSLSHELAQHIMLAPAIPFQKLVESYNNALQSETRDGIQKRMVANQQAVEAAAESAELYAQRLESYTDHLPLPKDKLVEVSNDAVRECWDKLNARLEYLDLTSDESAAHKAECMRRISRDQTNLCKMNMLKSVSQCWQVARERWNSVMDSLPPEHMASNLGSWCQTSGAGWIHEGKGRSGRAVHLSEQEDMAKEELRFALLAALEASYERRAAEVFEETLAATDRAAQDAADQQQAAAQQAAQRAVDVTNQAFDNLRNVSERLGNELSDEADKLNSASENLTKLEQDIKELNKPKWYETLGQWLLVGASAIAGIALCVVGGPVGALVGVCCSYLLASALAWKWPSAGVPQKAFEQRSLQPPRLTMGSGGSVHFQLTPEEAADVDAFVAGGLAQVPSLRRRVEELQAGAREAERLRAQEQFPEEAGAHNAEKLQEEVAQLNEEVRSLRQAEAAAARRIEELESRLREDPKERVSHSLPAPPGTSDAGTTPHDLAKDGDDKKVFVALLSGKDCECLWLQDRTIRQLKEEAQQKLDIAIKHLIGPNMEPLDEEKMLAEGNVMPGITLTVVAVDQAAEAKQAAEDEKEAAECRTDILLAALNGRLGAVRHILRTPGAVASKPEEICRVLAAKAEVDASVSGSTPLHFAAIKGQVEVVKLLVEAKASVIVKSKYGQTPLDDARKQGHDEVVTILENAA